MSEIKNKVCFVSLNEINAIKLKFLQDKNVYFVELCGSSIQTWKDYITDIGEKFRFPVDCLDSVDRYLDLMRDLDWLDAKKYILVIYEYKHFLQSNPELKNEILSQFAEIILPFWQDEVKEVVVEGKARPFMVYLVE